MNLSASNRLSYLFLFQNMLTRMCSRLRILCKHVQPRKKQQYYVHKKGCHRALIYSAVSRAFCIKCASQCWKCSFEIQNSSLFCSQCSTLQKPDENKNYFDVLGIEQSFEIKDKELTTKYRKMQNVLHPDRFSTRNVEEHEISEQYSALVNKAYSTLLQPLARGLYMLQLQGVNLDEETRQTDPQFLAEIMQTNEELAEAHYPDDVKELENANKNTMDKLIRDVASAFSTGDTNAAKEVLVKMKYYSSIGTRIKDLKQKTGIE